MAKTWSREKGRLALWIAADNENKYNPRITVSLGHHNVLPFDTIYIIRFLYVWRWFSVCLTYRCSACQSTTYLGHFLKRSFVMRFQYHNAIIGSDGGEATLRRHTIIGFSSEGWGYIVRLHCEGTQEFTLCQQGSLTWRTRGHQGSLTRRTDGNLSCQHMAAAKHNRLVGDCADRRGVVEGIGCVLKDRCGPRFNNF